MNPTGRFSNRVEYYVRYRPGYPDAALDVLHDVLKPGVVVADIGSGTGISSRWLLQRASRVYGVEPNREMRECAGAPTGFISVDGTAETTGLPDASVDVVVCATAFHWFRVDEARAEFRRILKPGGQVVLMWNIRDVGASPLQAGYEQAIADFAVDYRRTSTTTLKRRSSSSSPPHPTRKRVCPTTRSSTGTASSAALSQLPTCRCPARPATTRCKVGCAKSSKKTQWTGASASPTARSSTGACCRNLEVDPTVESAARSLHPYARPSPCRRVPTPASR